MGTYHGFISHLFFGYDFLKDGVEKKKSKEEWNIFKREREQLSSICFKEILEELYQEFSMEDIQIDEKLLLRIKEKINYLFLKN